MHRPLGAVLFRSTSYPGPSRLQNVSAGQELAMRSLGMG